MIIKAKFQTTCVKCKGPVYVGEQIEWTAGRREVHHIDTALCAARQLRAMMVDKSAPAIDTRLIALVNLVKSVISPDIKWPTLRLMFDKDIRISISITKTGLAPGSLAIKKNGEYYGCVRPSGEVTGSLRNDMPVQNYLLSVSNDKDVLIKEATLYGKLTNTCSFCGLELTHDYSVMVGYGPICADKWGLPHAYNGSDDNVPSGMSVDLKRKYMELMNSEE